MLWRKIKWDNMESGRISGEEGRIDWATSDIWAEIYIDQGSQPWGRIRLTWGRSSLKATLAEVSKMGDNNRREGWRILDYRALQTCEFEFCCEFVACLLGGFEKGLIRSDNFACWVENGEYWCGHNGRKTIVWKLLGNWMMMMN